MSLIKTISMSRTPTSILNGRDIQQLPFNYNITYRPKGYVRYDKMEQEINYILQGLPYDYGYYCWEKDKLFNHYHSHILLQTLPDGLSETIYSNIKGDKIKNNIRTGERELMVRVEKELLNTHTQKLQKVVMDKMVIVDYTEMYGRLGKVHIEPVVENIGVSYYTTKSTSYGLTSGYLQGKMV